MILTEKRKELNKLKREKKELNDKIIELNKSKKSKIKLLTHLIMTGFIGLISSALFMEILPILIPILPSLYAFLVPIYNESQKNKRIKIIELELANKSNEIIILENTIREIELENLGNVFKEENRKKFQIDGSLKEMPKFDRNNIESNIGSIEDEPKLLLKY